MPIHCTHLSFLEDTLSMNGRVLWLHPLRDVTVAGQRRSLTGLPPFGPRFEGRRSCTLKDTLEKQASSTENCTEKIRNTGSAIEDDMSASLGDMDPDIRHQPLQSPGR